MNRAILLKFAMLVATGLFAGTSVRAADAPQKVTYADDVQPIFRAKCSGCHNQDKRSGGLDLTNLTNLMQGGSSGTVIEPGDAANSYLFMLVSHESEPNMPPEGDKLPDDMLAVIKSWIDGGALENKASKAMLAKPKVDLTAGGASAERPDGPPPMPGRLVLEPVTHTDRPGVVQALATSPWAPLVAVAGQRQILLYHAQTLELAGVLPFPEGVPLVLQFSRNGKLLLAGGGRGAYQGRVAVYDIATGERVAEVGDEVDAVLAADISADHRLIALGGPSRMVRIYATQSGELLHSIKKHTEWVYAVAFSPDGVLLASADRNGGVHVWEAHTAREYLTLGGHGQAVTDLTWRSDSNLLASCSEDGTIALWEMNNGGRVKNWGAHGGGVQSVEFTRDGRLVSCGRDRVTKLWDPNGAEQRAFEAFPDLALHVSFSDETSRVIAGDFTGTVRVWNAADGARLGELALNPPTLEKRLKAAQEQLAAQEAAHRTLLDAATAAQAALDKAKTDLAAAQKVVTDLTAQVQTFTQTVAAGKQSVEALTGEVAALTQAVQKLEPVIAPLSESVTKGQAAVEKAPDDKELAAAITGLKAQLDKKSAELAAHKTALAEKTAALEKAKQDLAAAEQQLADTAAALKPAQETAAGLAPAVPTSEAAWTQAKQQSDASAAQAAAARNDVKRWQNEIAFRDKSAELATAEQKHAELAGVTAAAEQELQMQQAALAAAGEAATTAQKELEAAGTALTQSQQAAQAAIADRDATAKSLADLEAALPALKDAAEKTQAAAEKLPEDKEVSTAAAQVKALLDAKTQALATGKKSLDEKTALVEKSKQAVTEAEKLVASRTETLQQARSAVEQATTAASAAQQAFETAKKQSDAAAAVVEALRKDLDSLKTPAEPPAAVAQSSG